MHTLTHISGNPLTIDGTDGGPGFVIQRCALCGGVLIDTRGQVIARAMPKPGRAVIASRDIDDEKIPTWPVGRLIQVTIANPTQYVVLADTEKLPKDSCLDTI